MVDQEQLKQQIYSYFESLEWTMMPIEDVDYNTLVACLYRRVRVLELDIAALKRIAIAGAKGIKGIHAHWGNLVALLDDGASGYDEEVVALIDSIAAEFARFVHSADTEIQSAKERPDESETESSPD